MGFGCDLFDMGQKVIHDGADDYASFAERMRNATGLDIDDAAMRKIYGRSASGYAKSGVKGAAEVTRQARIGLAKQMADLHRSGVLETITGLRRAGMLAGVKTLARNVAGNTASAAFDEVSKVPGAIADMAIGKLTGTRTLLGPDPRSVMASLGESITKGSKQFLETMKQGATEADLAKFDIPRELNFPHWSGKPIEVYVNGVNRLQSGTDKWARAYAFSRSIDEQAQLIARAEKLKGDEYAKRVASLRKNPTEQMGLQAASHAEEAVFANTNRLTSAIEGGRSKLGPGGKFTVDTLIPFKRTPTNIVGRTIESSPLGFIKAGALVKKALTDPEAQREFAKTFGRATMGTASMYLGMELFRKGMLTPGYSSQPGERGREEAAGRQPASIKIDGVWHEIDDSPMGMLMVLAAGYAKELDDPAKGNFDTVKGMGGQTTKVLANAPLVRGAETLTQIKENPGSALTKIPGDFAKSFQPQITRSPKTKVDAFGNEVQKPEGMYRFIIPTGGIKDKSDDPVIKEIDRYKVSLGPIARFKKDSTGKKVEESDAEFEARQKATGQAVYKELKDYIASPYYKNADAQTRRSDLISLIRQVRASMSAETKYQRETAKK